METETKIEYFDRRSQRCAASSNRCRTSSLRRKRSNKQNSGFWIRYVAAVIIVLSLVFRLQSSLVWLLFLCLLKKTYNPNDNRLSIILRLFAAVVGWIIIL